MRKCRLGVMIAICVVMVIATLWPSYASAKLAFGISCENFSPGQTYDGSPLRYPEGEYFRSLGVSGQEIVDSSIQRPGFSFKLVSCIEDIIQNATAGHINDIGRQLQNIISAFLVLYLMLFGFKVAMGGVPNLKAELLTSALTIIIVFVMVAGGGAEMYVNVLRGAQVALAGVMTSAIENNSICDFNIAWLQFDCILAQILGTHEEGMIAAPNKIDAIKLMASPEGMFSLFQIIGGIIWNDNGIMYVAFIVVILLLMVLAIVHAMLVYISALLVITVLGILAPLFIPLILFKSTQDFFKRWLTYLLAHFLQPILVLGYLSFMMAIIGFLLARECPAGSNDWGNKCGLTAIFQEMRTNPDQKHQVQTKGWMEYVMTAYDTAKDAKDVAVDAYSALDRASNKVSAMQCKDTEKTSSRQCSEIRTAIFVFSLSKNEDVRRHFLFLQELMTLVVLLMVTFGLMADVLSNAGRLAGSAAETTSRNIHVYNRATSAVINYGKRKKDQGGGGG